LATGELVIKATEHGKSSRYPLYYAWRNNHQGKALAWFREQLCNDSHPVSWFGHSVTNTASMMGQHEHMTT